MMEKNVIQVHEKLPFWESLPLSLQHLFAMFGSTVLVPVLFGVDPGTILLMNGIGTLIYIFITKGKIPAYLGSSFAFISPVFVVLGRYSGLEGYSYALGGFFAMLFLALFIFMIAFGLLRSGEDPVVEDDTSNQYEIVKPSTSTNTGILRGTGGGE